MRKGEVYRTTTELPVLAMTEWAAPYTGGYERVLRAGEQFTIASDPAGGSAVYCDAVDYKRLHRELIPLSDRLRFWSYRGFYLCIPVKDIRARCELVASPPWRKRR